MKDLKKIKEKYEMKFMELDGVEGVGIGEYLGKPCINVYVSKKTKPIEELIPQDLEGYPVRLVPTGEFKAL